MEKVITVYERAYDEKQPVVTLDESPKQLIESKLFIGKDGIKYQDSIYTRHGVRDIYMVFELLAGKRYCFVEENHNRFTWVKIVSQLLDTIYKDCRKITLVEDNLSAHKPSAFYEVYQPEKAKAYLDRIEFVFTPTHGSWLNMAEIELSVLQRDCLDRHIATEAELIKQVKAWQESRNKKAVKANWQFTNEDARIKLKKLYPTI
ncbi:IS630 family transposase [Rhodocytophaga rosea]|uniref:IS630 family transposase n=1 Tax=Rhodocytophaga rosea TaxID=2704465 RepID=A0A6C0GJA2_9BACT|nr:IS630 family transposase [Rhodocytophaga rosea]